jgi:peptide/nickel transport system permease protein
VRYLGRRLGHAIVVLLGVSLLSFVLAEAAPGDFIDELRLDPRVSEATLTALRQRYALDRPLPQKYLNWLQSVARGELGFSMAYEAPVGPLLWPRARNTLLLTVPATALAWIIAVPLGAWAASHRGRAIDRGVAATTTALLSVPEVLIGLTLLIVALRTGVFPTGGMVSPEFAELTAGARVWDVARHLALPLTGLTLAILPVIVRHVRSSLTDVLDAPFIQASRASGIPERRLLFRHALRAAANPLTSLLGLSVAGLLSASLVVEQIMSWPGLGPLTLDAVASRDLHVVVAAVTCSTGLLVLGTLLADGLLYLADPRVRAEGR